MADGFHIENCLIAYIIQQRFDWSHDDDVASIKFIIPGHTLRLLFFS